MKPLRVDIDLGDASFRGPGAAVVPSETDRPAAAPPPPIADPEFTGCIWFTDHLGRATFMERKERLAIDATGRCSLERYMHQEDEYPEPTLKAKAAAMGKRPGATSEGQRPVQLVQVDRKSSGNPTRAPQPAKWHLRYRSGTKTHAVCGANAVTADVFAFSRFYHMRMDPRVCQACRALMIAERQQPNGRKTNNISRSDRRKGHVDDGAYVKPLNYTAKERKDLGLLNPSSGGRGYVRGTRGGAYEGDRY